MTGFTVTGPTPARLVDVAKAHLVVVPVDAIGGLIDAGGIRIGDRRGRIPELVRPGDVLHADADAVAARSLRGGVANRAAHR